MKTNSTSNLPKARISRLSRKDIESYQEALGNDAYSKELVAEFAVVHVKAHALQTEIYRRIASGDKRKGSGKPLSPNAERARIIAKAKVFAEEYGASRILQTRIEITEQRDKRKVTAKRMIGANTLHSKEVRAHPDDVYNFHIGKAIAIGRLLGKDVSEFENAPQPTDFVVGHVVKGGERLGFYRPDRKFTLTSKQGYDSFYYAESTEYQPGNPHDYIYTTQMGAIIDDTDAIYEDVTT